MAPTYEMYTHILSQTVGSHVEMQYVSIFENSKKYGRPSIWIKLKYKKMIFCMYIFFSNYCVLISILLNLLFCT